MRMFILGSLNWLSVYGSSRSQCECTCFLTMIDGLTYACIDEPADATHGQYCDIRNLS